MRRDDRTRRGPGRDARRRQATPRVEGLEGRLLLYATTGGAWQHPSLITYSFVPDGARVFYLAPMSNLFQAFNAKWSTATWEGVFQQAAAIWEQVANVNLVQVSDNGTEMGSGAYQQGDPGMGDIRISGLPSSTLGSATLGETLPLPPIDGGTDSGDIIMNTSQPWKINGDVDLLTVAIHEFGHALGMDHSAISSADMYAYYSTLKQSITPDDVAGIDSIYGPRQADWIAAGSGNSTAAHSFDLTPYLTSQGWLAAGGLDIQNSGTPEWYKATAPANTNGTLLVTMQSTNFSALSPFLEVENSAQQVIGYNFTYGGYTGGSVTVKITGVAPGQLYYIGAGAAVGGPTGAGNYGLEVNFGSTTLGAFPLTLTPIATTWSTGGGADPLTIAAVGPAPGPSDDAGPADPDAPPAPAVPLLLIAPTDPGDDPGAIGSPTPIGPLGFGKAARGRGPGNTSG